jgi:hypothetical protein
MRSNLGAEAPQTQTGANQNRAAGLTEMRIGLDPTRRGEEVPASNTFSLADWRRCPNSKHSCINAGLPHTDVFRAMAGRF